MIGVDGRPVARTAQGDLLGVRAGAVDVWRAIPYARPPVGELRFAAPQPAPSWVGIRDAAQRAPAAIQPPLVPGLRTSEDCLYLNVTAPTQRPSALPVIVWLHGGGFRIGAGDEAIDDGRSLAVGGAVIVSLNYRLGAWGFLHLGEQAPDAANCGLLDQLAALDWVQRNSAAFGGDPDRVTVLGASAGAKSLGVLLALPRSVAVMRRAISMSGGADFTNTVDEAAELRARLMRALDLPADADVATLRALPAEAILAAQESLATGVASTWTWRPTVDGRLLSNDPLSAIRAGSARGVDLLAGTVADEARLFTSLHPTATAAAASVAEQVFGDRHQRVLAAYAEPAGAGADAASRFMTAERYRVPTLRLVEAQQQHAPTRLYRFGSTGSGLLPSGHGADASLVWADAERCVDRVRPVARGMQQAWLAFARDGEPVGDGLPAWPAYLLDERATMLLDLPSQVVADPDRVERDLWADVTWRPGSWAS